MKHELPALPYAHDALEPCISAETLEYHHEAHHAGYLARLNELIAGTQHAGQSLEEIVRDAPAGPVYHNAAQAWNHAFYWNSLSPQDSVPDGALRDAILDSFGSFSRLRDCFTGVALSLFGSGWAWLVADAAGRLSVRALGNAGNPLRDGQTPLLVCDLWEHAYYLDYRNRRTHYLKAWWDLINWDFAAQNLQAAATLPAAAQRLHHHAPGSAVTRLRTGFARPD